MNRMKSLFALVLVLLILMLAGCSNANVTPGAAVTVPSQDDMAMYPAGRDDIQCRILPETVEAPEGVTVLKWVCLGATSTMDYMLNQTFYAQTQWNDEAVRALNETLQQQGKSYRLQFVMFSTSADRDIDWFRVPEVLEVMDGADLITGPFAQERMQSYLLPLTQYVEAGAEYPLANAVLHEINWIDTTVNGEIYGIPAATRYAVGSGWNISSNGLARLGLRPTAFNREYWEMEGIFRAIYQENGGEPFLRAPESGITRHSVNGISVLVPSAASAILDKRFDMIGSCFAIDYSGEKPVVVNYLRTDDVRSIQEAMVLYGQEGYFISDPSGVQLLDYSGCFSDETYSYTWGSGKSEMEIICVPVSRLHYVQSGSPLVTGILRESANARQALMLLSDMAEDELLRDRILQRQEDGSYSMGFLSPLETFDLPAGGNADMLYPAKKNTDRMTSYRQVLENVQVWQAVPFDFSTLEQEEQAVRQVLEAYLGQFPTMSEADYDRMLQQIGEAGEEYIQSELQRQLDDWYRAQQN